MNLYFFQRRGGLMAEPRCYCGGSAPTPQDPNQAAAAGAIQDTANYPFEAQINALAQLGGKAWINGKYYDFTGLGNASQNAAVAAQNAQSQLAIQQLYGPQYIAQSLANLKQANPTGVAARNTMFQDIINASNQPPDNTMSQGVQNQVLSLLGQGSNLTTGPNSQTEAVQQQIRGQQVGNGIFLGNAPAAAETTALINAGDQQQQQREAQAQSFLGSGISPQDVTYRRVQQGLSNLANAISGQTPESQFSSIAAAANGAAPYNTSGVTGTAPVQTGAAQGLSNAASL
ncbi:MAG: hypothetical protein KGL39_53010, partial [Patescibacteria group bacterium]|nr:hypothetical protein [Patescibacteria group bacterium]